MGANVKTTLTVACAAFLLATGPIIVSPAHADDLGQVLKRLATLEREHATLEQENAALRDRVRRLEGKRTIASAKPQRVIMDARLEGSPQRPQDPYAAVYKAPSSPATPPTGRVLTPACTLAWGGK